MLKRMNADRVSNLDKSSFSDRAKNRRERKMRYSLSQLVKIQWCGLHVN